MINDFKDTEDIEVQTEGKFNEEMESISCQTELENSEIEEFMTINNHSVCLNSVK